MKDLFQKLKAGGPAGQPRLTLAVFGKHPGWDDHIPAIGLETDALASIEKVLYHDGIRGQIDSGAWEKGKLEPEQRLDGYDHVFLWSRPGHVLLGQLWSSVDGKGRLNYPMVLCIDGEGVSTAFMLETVRAGLDRIKDACKAAATADAVINTSRAAQEQLRGLLVDASGNPAEKIAPLEVRRQFLDHRELGPDRQGLLRILHDLASLPGINLTRSPSPSAARGGSRHLRLPLAADSRNRSLLLWVRFLRCVLPESVPLLLLARRNVMWFDLIAGEPEGEDFFCLQASSKALPLTTEIPYDVAPELKERLRQAETKFLDGGTTFIASAKSATAPAATAPPMLPASSPPPVASSAPAPAFTAAAAPPSKSRSSLPLVGGAVLLLALGVAAFFMFRGDRNSKEASVPKAAEKATQEVAGIAAKPTGNQEQEYATAFTAARAAYEKKDYSNAIAQGELALRAKTNDPAAVKLLGDARQAVKEETDRTATNAAWVALQSEKRQLYQSAMKEASNAWTQAETAYKQANYASALTGIDAALAQSAIARTNGDAVAADRLAAVLKERKGAIQVAMTNRGEKAARYASAMKAATNGLMNADAALKQSNYDAALKEVAGALAQCDIARTNGDSAAADQLAAVLKERQKTAGSQMQKAKQEREQYDLARNYSNDGKYDEAIRICNEHRGAGDFDALSVGILTEQKALAESGEKFKNGDYSFVKDLQAQSYSGKKPFAELLGNAVQEEKFLAELKALERTTNWTAVRTQLLALSSESLKKPPFADLSKWAENQSKDAKATNKRSLQELDTDLEVLLVSFNVLKPTDPKIQSEKARKATVFPAGAMESDAQEYYLRELGKLETEYKQGNWLSQNDRAKSIRKLRDTIRIR